MRIHCLTEKNIRACCVFEHKGYTVSASTICKPAQVLVYQDKRDLYDATSIPDAIEWINKQE
jgi:hypothetical protein